MKNSWYSILCVIVLGCNYNTNLDNKENESYEEIWQETVLSRSLDYDEQLILKKEEFCQKFNLAKGNVLSTISVGYQNYMSKGGCGEKCYKKDLDSALFKVYSNLWISWKLYPESLWRALYCY